MRGTNIGEFEELVILVIANLHENAYGLSIRDFIIQKCNRNVSLSTIHSTIHRLEDKGFLRSKYNNENVSERGGRPKLIFTITSSGKEVIQATKALRNDLWDTIPKLSFE